MTITTKLEDITTEGAKIGVRIKKERPEKPEGMPEALNVLVDDLHDSMEIQSILRALKDYNERAFSIAMEHFIEEELSDGESVC